MMAKGRLAVPFKTERRHSNRGLRPTAASRPARSLRLLTWCEAGASPQALVPLLEEAEDGVEEHAVSGLLRGIQELACRDAVVAPHAPEEPQGGQHLVLGQQDFHDLVIGRRESLERSPSECGHRRRLRTGNVDAPYLQHIQRELVRRRVEALQG